MAKTLFVVASGTTITRLYTGKAPEEMAAPKALSFTHKLRINSEGGLLLYRAAENYPQVLVHESCVVEVEAPTEVSAPKPTAPKAPATSGKKVLSALPGTPRCDCGKCNGTGLWKDSYNKEEPNLCLDCFPGESRTTRLSKEATKALKAAITAEAEDDLAEYRAASAAAEDVPEEVKF